MFLRPLAILCNGDTLTHDIFTVEEDILPDDDVVWQCSPRLVAWFEEHGLRAVWYLNHTLGVAAHAA